MKMVIRLFLLLASLGGVMHLVRLSGDNYDLSDQITQLETELGRMSIDDANKVYLAEIATPDVPPEVASHVERVWQFRCYLPPGYDFMRYSGGGRVAHDGIFLSGSSGSSWGSPQPEATHKLLTISFQIKSNRCHAFYSFGESSGTSSWGPFNPASFDDSLVIQKLVNSTLGPRSFDQETILPLLKIFDSTTAEDKEVAGQTLTTYAGGFFVLCPKSRQSRFAQLIQGKTPSDFDPGEIASEAGNE